MNNTEQLQRTERLMMYLCDAIDYSDSLAEALSCLLGYKSITMLKDDADAFCNYFYSIKKGAK